MEFNHISVLLKETIEGLDIKSQGTYLDGTLGGGGHSREILKRLSNGKLIGIDQDLDALEVAKKNLSQYGDKLIVRKSNFKDFDKVLDQLGISKIDGFLVDLGVSSFQLDQGSRGFSYHQDYLLDMRMDRDQVLDAYQVVNTYSKEDLERIIYEYSEEKWARRIAEFIVEERKNKEIRTTLELVEVIKKAIPRSAREDKHPAIKTFQAIRIEVNDELNILETTLKKAVDRLKKGGRLAVITFHSLEDRIVKKTLRELESSCICDPRAPICTCDKISQIKIVTRKPIVPGQDELKRNKRSRSAKLRIAEKK